MHFGILDFEEKKDDSGSYTSYSVSINGGYHSSLRYRQLRDFHEQLKKEFGTNKVPDIFPPKKLLSLTSEQIATRREQLEKYLQTISQDTNIASSRTFVKFFLKAQKESSGVEEDDVKLDVYLLNGKKFEINVRNTDATDHVVQEALAHIKLPHEMNSYFSLFLMTTEDNGEILIVRKLQNIESPYIVLVPCKETHQLVIRKNFWNARQEEKLYVDKIALNLLYVQTEHPSRNQKATGLALDEAVSDVERSFIVTKPEASKELEILKTKNEREKYLLLARTQKCYGCIQLKPCVMDYPESESHVLISAGNYELTFRLVGAQKRKATEGSLKVTRIRCWRVISSKDTKNGEVVTKIALEYLFSKDKLEWITITSEQAMLISLCLQSMVDEIISQKSSGYSSKSKATLTNKENPDKSSMAKDSSQKQQHKSVPSNSTNGSHTETTDSQGPEPSAKKSSKKRLGKNIAQVKNEVFAQDIGDNDL